MGNLCHFNWPVIAFNLLVEAVLSFHVGLYFVAGHDDQSQLDAF